MANQVKVDKNVLGQVQKDEVVASPGMKYKHYAPNTKCMMVYSENADKMIKKINEITMQNENVLILFKKIIFLENLHNISLTIFDILCII